MDSNELRTRIRNKLGNAGEVLIKAHGAEKYRVEEDGSILFEVCASDAEVGSASLRVQDSTEVFIAEFPGGYKSFRTAYTIEDKLEVLDDFLDLITLYLDKKFFRRVFENFSGVVYTQLHIVGPEAVEVLATSQAPLGAIRRHLASRVSEVYPGH